MACVRGMCSEGGGRGNALVVHSLLVGVAIAAAAAAHYYGFRYFFGLQKRVVGIIPARFNSSRFQGKPLVQILGKPMIQRTWERAKLATMLDHVGIIWLLPFGCWGLADRLHYFTDGAPDAVFSTAVTSLNPHDGMDPKCVVDKNGYAIYFSRGLIPFNKSAKVNPEFPCLLHLGIQSYDAKFLQIYPKLPSTPLQLEEDLEQLKVLEHGYMMKVVKVNHESHGVDVPEDVEKIECFMRQRNIS